MGEVIEFRSDGETAQGHLALPPGGRGPGVVLLQGTRPEVRHPQHAATAWARTVRLPRAHLSA